MVTACKVVTPFLHQQSGKVYLDFEVAQVWVPAGNLGKLVLTFRVLFVKIGQLWMILKITVTQYFNYAETDPPHGPKGNYGAVQIMGELANHQESAPPPRLAATPSLTPSLVDQSQRGPRELRPGHAVPSPRRLRSGRLSVTLRGGAGGLAETPGWQVLIGRCLASLAAQVSPRPRP